MKVQQLLRTLFIFNLLFSFLIYTKVEAQKLKLSKERIAALNSISSSQKDLWQAEMDERERSMEAMMDKAARENPNKHNEFEQHKLRWARIREKEKYTKDSLKRIEYNVRLKNTTVSDQSKLDLKGGLFENIPHEVYRYQQLDTLIIGDNRITYLDKEVFLLPKLTRLSLAYNQLGSMKIRIPKNNSIQDLDLSSNGLQKVPSGLKNLIGLKKLNLSNNELGKNGKRVKLKKLKELEELNLSDNELTKIPRSVKKLKKLKILKLNNTNLVSLKGLQRLNSLVELELSNNIVALDPRYFYSLNNLEKLTMRKCALIHFPPEIAYLSSLKKLVLPENKLTQLPIEIGQLKNLENLMVYKNQLTEIPEEVFELKELLWLDIYYNQIEHLSDRISNLGKLEILYLSHNKFDELPSSLGEVVGLRELYIHHNQLRELPDISKLKELKYLHLQYNHLTEFPKAILALTQLEELDLSNNLIVDFPEEIRNFKNLNFIYLNRNQTDLLSDNYEKFKVALKELNDKGVGIRFDYPEELTK